MTNRQLFQKRVGLVLIGCLAALTACTPSIAVIQTAIAQTQSVQPLPTAAVSQTASNEQSGLVTHIVDGDTVDVDINGEIFRVRYIGIDTPERDEVCYTEATAANSNLVLNKMVTMRKDKSETDRFGRLLRYIYQDELFVNAELVRLGFAEAREYKPDIAQADFLEGFESQARADNLACYATGVFGDSPTPTGQVPLSTQASQAFDTNGDGKVTCSDFSTHAEAQAAYNAGQTSLDGSDNDGQACETLP